MPEGESGLKTLERVCAFLRSDPNSPLQRAPTGADSDAHIDVRAVFHCSHSDLNLDAMPELLLPKKGRFGLIDYEKVFCPDLKHGPDIFDQRRIIRSTGALVIIRPDQYVAGVLPISATEEVSEYFGRLF